MASENAPELCGRCGQSFVLERIPDRHQDTLWCRSCVDRCHESTDFAHTCPICTSEVKPLTHFGTGPRGSWGGLGPAAADELAEAIDCNCPAHLRPSPP